MKNAFKIIIYLLIGTFFILFITVLCLPFIINPNDFKAQIETTVKQQTGRTLSIHGDITFSLFPWLGFSTESMTLGNAQGFTPPYFAQLQYSEIKVKLMPLLSKQVEVSQIIVKGLQLHLSKNKQGVSNWDDLIPSTQENINTPYPLAMLAIAGLSIENAQIIWHDEHANLHTQIDNLYLNVGQLKFEQKIPLKLSLTLINQHPKLTQSLDFSSDLILNPTLTIFQLKNIQLTLASQSPFIPLESLLIHLSSDLQFNQPEQSLQLSGLKITGHELTLNAEATYSFKKPSHLRLTLGIEPVNVRHLWQQTNLNMPKITDQKALTHLKLDLQIQAHPNQLTINSLVLNVDETILKGSATLTDFSKPKVQFNLSMNKLNIDRYLPPKRKTTLQKIPTPASTAALSISLIPVETLRKLNISGQLSIEELKVNNLKIQGILLKLSADKGIIQSQQTFQHFYQGQYQGGFNLNVMTQKPIFIIDEHFNRVALAPLLNDIYGKSPLKGLIEVNAQLTAQGKNSQALRTSLNGTINILLKQGMLQNVKPPWGLTFNPQPVFSNITAKLNIHQGLIQNNDLLGLSPKIKFTGDGNANLITKAIDYTVTLIPAIFPEILSNQPMMIHITGNFNHPRYQFNISPLLSGKNHSTIKTLFNHIEKNIPKKLDQFLDKVL